MLRPALCLSRSGRATAKSFTVRGAPAKVHTNLLQLLIAHQVTESMVEQLLGVTDATGVTTIQVRLAGGGQQVTLRSVFWLPACLQLKQQRLTGPCLPQAALKACWTPAEP